MSLRESVLTTDIGSVFRLNDLTRSVLRLMGEADLAKISAFGHQRSPRAPRRKNPRASSKT